MWRVFMRELVHAVACVLLVWCPSGGEALAGSCEAVRIPLCSPMPWNMTKMPNHLHHSTQANAILAIEQYEALLGTGCSADLLFFLCAMYAPICTISFQRDPIKPCKSVCERAKSGCEPVLKKYNHSWPESLACDELPVYDRAVCISPEAIVKADPSDNSYFQDPSICSPEMNPDFEIEVNSGNCQGVSDCKCKNLKICQKTYIKNNYNYVIRARVKEIKSRSHDLSAVVEVKDVLKSSLVHIPRDTVTLHYSSGCLCPVLRPNEEYIIMGYENEERSRLLLIEGSIAQKWKDRVGRKVKRWNTLPSKNNKPEMDRRPRP
ncbi:secreted frizzled-related protein 3 isoform 1-T1 [Clarias gariepinus]|uniref:secreted frizzled-related protein 3 isoform X1 n=1 Tax=Clarias gariepinus TaxID=13013 RepID=UPI00234DEEF3|nr:secreted frizzled-related protein 3 isoform X1 [Clarias gariepinus]